MNTVASPTLTGCNPAKIVLQPRNAIYISAVISKNLNPFKIVYAGDWIVCQHLWSPLVELSSSNEPRPLLAESWTRSTDGLIWKFKLRNSLKWSDGTPMLTAQIVQSLKYSAAGTSHTKLSFELVSIQQTQDHEITFTLKKAVPSFLLSLSYVDWGIVHPNFFTLLENKNSTNRGPYSGPFSLVKIGPNNPAEEVELKKNQFHPFAASNVFDEARIKSYTDCKTLVENQDQIVSFRAFRGNVTSDQKALENSFDLSSSRPSWVIGFEFTTRGLKKFTSDKRRALLIQLHEAMKANPPPFGIAPATGLLVPHLFGSLKEDEFYQYLQELKKTIEPINKPITNEPLRIVVNETLGAWPSYRWLIDTLQKLGYKVQSTVLSRSDYTRILGTPEHTDFYDLDFWGLGAGDPDPDGTWQTASKNFFAPGLINTNLVDQATTEKDTFKREAIYKNLGRQFVKDAFYVPLRIETDIVGVFKKYKIVDTAIFRAGNTFFDLAPKE